MSDQDMRRGEQLVEDMSEAWDLEASRDSFKTQILQLVEAKAKAAELESITQVEPAESESTGATIYDLTELLQRRLDTQAKPKPKPPSRAKAAPPKGRSATKPPAKALVKRKTA